MYTCRREDFVLHKQPEVLINGECVSIEEAAKYSCYMDRIYPLFSGDGIVKDLAEEGLNKNGLEYSVADIKNIFGIDNKRFERHLDGVGNEIFKAMAAIGFCNKKEIFCFPWLSNKRFESYHFHLTHVLDILNGLGKIVIIPIGFNMNVEQSLLPKS